MKVSEARRLFIEAVSKKREEEIELARAALLFAKELEYPELDIERYMDAICSMAEEVRRYLGGSSDPELVIEKISRYLFFEKGFKGNTRDYYNPKNSFLNDVLDGKLGIPITLSILYMEIAGRVGLSVSGVGFPGHFLVKCKGRQGEDILIDPFNEGRVISERDCQTLLNRIYRGRLRFRREFLASATKKQILARMLRNLKLGYINSRNYKKALPVIDLILIVDPIAVDELRDRGLIYYALECFSQALSDLETYISLFPNASDRDLINHCIKNLKRLVERIN
ncbi:MAG: hypothetical protein KatS3mg078_0256 [Deltaproteobacteria bacterium]|nr:MAG: hypothetical protein KatS3mg078_0256 [Deltaproteobacteria bacterium]